MRDIRITATELAELVGVSVQQIGNYRRDGLIAYGPDRRFSLKTAFRALIAHYRGRRTAGTDGEGRSLNEAKLQAEITKISAQADREIMLNERIAGNLASVSEMNEVVSAMSGALRNKMLGIPSRLADTIVGHDDPAKIRALLSEAIRDALSEFHALDWEEVRSRDKALRNFATLRKAAVDEERIEEDTERPLSELPDLRSLGPAE